MRLWSAAFACFAIGALLLGCGDDSRRHSFEYLRNPSYFRADTTLTEHPFCEGSNPLGADCRKERKYKLTWQRPEDTVNLKGYRIYLDTAPDDKHWESIQGRPELAAVIVDRFPLKDSVVFVFTSERKSLPDTLRPDQERMLALDSVGRADPITGRLLFALVPIYGGNVTPGQPQFAYFVTTDRQAPDVFHPDFRPLPHGVSIAWERPTDRVSFFNPSMDTGVISGYRLEVGLDGRTPDGRRNAFHPKIRYYKVGGADSTASVRDSIIRTDKGLTDRVQFLLPDGHRSAKHTRTDLTDSMRIEIEGMIPQDSLTFKLWALDSAGNPNYSAMEKVSLRTTDTTQPSLPRLSVDSLGLNGFTIIWTASRDSVAGPDGRLAEAGLPNANIKEYRLTRILVRAPGDRTTSQDRVDTTLQDALLPDRPQFRVPVRFLPPGTLFRLAILAEDSSGYLSRIDSLEVSTLKVAFADSDSVLTCPPGFIPMPRGTFTLGSEGQSTGDEVPAHKISMAPFCIEPYEHRDSTGQRFLSNVTYEQADSICRSVPGASRFDTRLCSEAEWERACEGAAATALLHGIQSEKNDPSILQTSCNQGTSDSAMAMSFALRNPICLTSEGAYDLAGNLSEWVRDTYDSNAYKATPADMDHAFAFQDSAGKAPHVLRGGNYLKPNLTQLASVQSLARCSNRDYPEQVRPIYREDCKSDARPKMVVIYGPGLNGHRCYEVPEDKFLGPDVTELIPAPKDSARILVFYRGVPKADTFTFVRDSTFKGKRPLSARLTTKALAEVTFDRITPTADSGKVNSYTDILDATEFRDTTQTGLAAIFRREASNPGWAVRKENGKYAIKYYYAYAELGSKPAKPYYSSRAIGFRCCSLAAKPAAPAGSGAVIPSSP